MKTSCSFAPEILQVEDTGGGRAWFEALEEDWESIKVRGSLSRGDLQRSELIREAEVEVMVGMHTGSLG